MGQDLLRLRTEHTVAAGVIAMMMRVDQRGVSVVPDFFSNSSTHQRRVSGIGCRTATTPPGLITSRIVPPRAVQ